MSAKTLMPQNYCPDVTDHPAHSWQDDTSRSVAYHRCPGRYTPSRYRAPDPSPAVPVDPFSGLDD